MDLSAVITKDFIFSSVPPLNTNLYLPLSIFFGVVTLAGIGLIFLIQDEKKMIWKRYETPFLLTGILGLIHLGARYEQLPWLASRFFLILIVTVLFSWTFALALTMTRLVPEVKREREITEKFNKYLPKNKAMKHKA